MQDITLNVNGQVHHLRVEPDTPLIYVLRNDLGLKAAKLGCGLEQCGACKVLIDGQAVPSCRLPVRAAQGKHIVTLEGLSLPGRLHPVQQAFIDEGAVQCGFCTPGLIVAAVALLDRNPTPSDGEIRAELGGNLCRCGTYERVLRAVRRATAVVSPRRPVERPLFEQYDLALPAEAGGTAGQGSIPALPAPFRDTPDLDSWVRVDARETVTLFTGKVELGQGIHTALVQIGAEELDLSPARIRVAEVDTDYSPDEGFTVSSMSLETTGNAIRVAAAEARHIMLTVASEELEAPLERLAIDDGTISDPATGRSTSYWHLFAGKKFGCRVTGIARPKGAGAYNLVGRPLPRLELEAKVRGRARFVHDLELPGLVHGRVVRPPNYDARLLDVKEAAVRRRPGVLAVVRDGSFLGVIAEREEQAVAAAEALGLAATWKGQAELPAQERLMDYMVTQADEPMLVVGGTPVDGPIPPIEPPAAAVQTLTATYFRPYQMHAALGPSAAVALMSEGRLTVWTHAQGVYPPRAALAQVLGLEEAQVRVIHGEGPGCYGHTGADDAALDAALLARALPGHPVSVKWSRTDEHTWEPYGPATVIHMQASLDEAGEVIDWNHDVWGYTHLGRAGAGGEASSLLAAWHLARPFPLPRPRASRWPQSSIYRNADPLYTFPRRRIVKHFLADSPLRISALRSLGSYANVLAIESFMDELAWAAGVDPLAFRLRYLADERARAVLQAAAGKAGWQARPRPRADGWGQGLAFAQYKNRQCYAAVVVDLSVDRASGRIRLERAVIAADAGQVVNPDGLSSQFEGGFLQGASWTLKEQVGFDQQGVYSTDWTSYPVLRLPEAPAIETVLLNRPGQPYLGAGEAAPIPTGAAIANAVFDAVGIRLRQVPFTPARVLAALRDLPGS